MNVNIRNRFIAFAVVAVLMFGVLFVQLFRLTIVEGDEHAAAAGALNTRTITVPGARGSILDQSGLPLAYDQKSYNVQFYRDPKKNTAADRAYYTGIIIDAINIIEGNNEKTVDTFAIKFDETKKNNYGIKFDHNPEKYYFDFGLSNEAAKSAREKSWRSNMYIKDATATPEEIYLSLRNRYQIPEEMDFTEASKILSIWQDVQLNSWVAYEPITVAYDVSIQTVAEIETHSAELEGMSISESTKRIYPRGSVAAHVIGYESRITEDILKQYTQQDEVLMGRITSRFADDLFKQYVTPDASAIGGRNLADFGFTPMQLANVQTMLDLGYSVDDLVGVEGIEKSMEAYLSGNTTDRQGKEEVQVDNMAIVQSVLSSTEPKQGDNVMLTLDIGLQLVAEQSLADNIPEIYNAQVEHFLLNPDTDPYDGKVGDYTGLDMSKLQFAKSGAVVVLDVNTGNVLAMANYPSYDLNMFTGGIADDVYKSLLSDPAKPLFNKATQSLATPGSVFKMVTATAALMEGEKDITKGTTLGEKITCEYKYTDGIAEEDAPHCWTRNTVYYDHIDQDVVKGLRNSCNFYFYTLAGRLGISNINKWGDKFGLTSSTGIELPGEQIGIIGNQTLLFDPTKPVEKQKTSLPMLVMDTGKYSITKALRKYDETREIQHDEATIKATAEALVNLMSITWTPNPSKNNVLEDSEGNSMGQHIRSILSDMMDIRENTSQANNWDDEISGILSQLLWTKYMTVTTGIGQGIIEVTPIAVARYVAAIANGGTVYQTHIVDKVIDQEGNIVLDQQPEVFDTLGANSEYIDAIQLGMSKVVSAEEGTANDYFKDFPDEYLKLIAGKTGTAQVTTVDLENNSWFVCFGPYSEEDPSIKPEIAVVVFIPNGYKGGLSSLVAQDILEYYFDRQKISAEQTIPGSDSLVG